MLIHLGDLGGVDVIDALLVPGTQGGTIMPAYMVFGNVDWDADDLERYAHAVGVHVAHPMGFLEIDGKTIAFTHGHEPAPMEQALAEGVDYLLHGHTHQAKDKKQGKTRVINPGALFRASSYTVAIVDPGRDQVEFLTLPDV